MREMTYREFRTNLADTLNRIEYQGETVIITRRGKPAARIGPVKEPAVPEQKLITVVSATAGDRIDGIEISDPAAPIDWAHLPQIVREWAEQQGYGAEDELLYILNEGAEVPVGFESLAFWDVAPAEAEARDSMRAMSNSELMEQYLSYGIGGNDAIDREVFRRWPTLQEKAAAMELMQQEHQEARHADGAVDLDELPPPTPGYAEAMEEYRQEARRLAHDEG